jgi:hypothetical protein
MVVVREDDANIQPEEPASGGVGLRCSVGSTELTSTYRDELEGKVAYKIIVAKEENGGQT